MLAILAERFANFAENYQGAQSLKYAACVFVFGLVLIPIGRFVCYRPKKPRNTHGKAASVADET